MTSPKTSMAQLVAEVRERGRQRDAIADALLGGLADGDSVTLQGKDGMTAIAGPDASKPGGYRVTLFEGGEPIGHTEARTMIQAVRQALIEGFEPSDASIVQANQIRSIEGRGMSKVDDLRYRMFAVVQEAEAHGGSHVNEPLRLAGRMGPLNLVEAAESDWTPQTPTYLAGDLPVSEGVGNRNGSVMAFWIGDRDPKSPAVAQAMTGFLSDHDVVGVRFIRALPVDVHPSIKDAWEKATDQPEVAPPNRMRM